MTCITIFCDRLAARPGDHTCELAPDHQGACRCECDRCPAVDGERAPAQALVLSR